MSAVLTRPTPKTSAKTAAVDTGTAHVSSKALNRSPGPAQGVKPSIRLEHSLDRPVPPVKFSSTLAMADRPTAGAQPPLLTGELPLASAAPSPSKAGASVPSKSEVLKALSNPAVVEALHKQAGALEDVLFPTLVTSSLRLGEGASTTATRLFLINFRKDAGSSADSVERVLVDQLATTHLKIAQMHALAATTT